MLVIVFQDYNRLFPTLAFMVNIAGVKVAIIAIVPRKADRCRFVQLAAWPAASCAPPPSCGSLLLIRKEPVNFYA